MKAIRNKPGPGVYRNSNWTGRTARNSQEAFGPYCSPVREAPPATRLVDWVLWAVSFLAITVVGVLMYLE